MESTHIDKVESISGSSNIAMIIHTVYINISLRLLAKWLECILDLGCSSIWRSKADQDQFVLVQMMIYQPLVTVNILSN